MRNLIFLCLLCFGFGINAQQYPPEWVKYTSGGYMYDIQSDINSGNMSETKFKDNLLNIARTNLAKQIQVQVQDEAKLNKSSLNGKTSISYLSETRFSTDVNLKLVETKTSYNSTTKEGYAIAFIDRDAARNYYKNELMLVYNKIDNSVVLSENFIEVGFKAKAKSELESSLKHFASIDEPLLWMNIFGASQSELSEWTERFNAKEQSIKHTLANLKHSTTIYLSCSADIFGKPYSTLQNELKGVLADEGCSFTTNPTEADWVIKVNCTSRKHSSNKFQGMMAFAYVNAHIIIEKVVTSQRIYENEISIKGGSANGMFGNGENKNNPDSEYSIAAEDAYKKAKKEIGKIILKNIKQ